MKTPILRNTNAVYAKFIWGGEDSTLYRLYHMNAFTLKHVLLWKNYTDTYAKHDSDSINWLNTLLITTSTDALNIRFNDKFDLLPIIEKGGIVCLKIMPAEMFFMHEGVV